MFTDAIAFYAKLRLFRKRFTDLFSTVFSEFFCLVRLSHCYALRRIVSLAVLCCVTLRCVVIFFTALCWVWFVAFMLCCKCFDIDLQI